MAKSETVGKECFAKQCVSLFLALLNRQAQGKRGSGLGDQPALTIDVHFEF